MVLIGVLGIQALNRDWLETGFLALLPASEQKPEIAYAIDRHNQPVNRKVIWLTGAAGSGQAIALARKLKEQVKKSSLFSKTVLEVPQQQAIEHYRRLFPYRYQLLDAKSQLTLANKPEALLAQNREMLYSPLGQMQAASLEQDPLLLFNRYFSSQNPVTFNLEQGIVVLYDGNRYWALLWAELKDVDLPLDKLENLLKLVRDATKQIKAAGGELMASGLPLFTAYGAESAKAEISMVGVGSSLGIILLLLLTFRSIRPLLLSSLAIASGLVAALIVCIVVFGKIHIITLVFGASLIGVADDYAQHYLCDSFAEKNWNPQRALSVLLPGLFLGLISNLLSYAGLGFSPFPGLQEVALFSAVGLLVAWLTVIMLFPLLLTGFSFEHEPGLLKLATLWEQRWPAWVMKNRRSLSLLLLLFIVGGILKLTPQDDVRLLQSASPEVMQIADKIKQLLPVSRDSQFFLVAGSNQQDWYQNEQRLLENLSALKQRQALKSYEGISSYWPDTSKQQDNYRVLKRTLYDSGLAERYMTDLGFSSEAVKSELKNFKESEHKTLELTAWLATADEAKRQLWLGCDQGRCLGIVALSEIKDIAVLSALQELPGVSWVDQVDQLSSLFKRYRTRASLLLFAAFGLVLLGLTGKFGWRGAATIMAIPTVSVLAALSMLGWFNQLFSLFNLFALLLVLGIGVDYAVFFFLAGEKRVSTSLAVILSALTTLLAFGLLAVSSTEIVHAFGFTVSVGIVTAISTAPLVGRLNSAGEK
jgi:predicted exporter